MISRSFESFLRTKKQRPIRKEKKNKRVQLNVEQLEVREVLTAFTPGNLVVMQEGDGVTQYTEAAPIFLDEYTTGLTPTLIQQVAIPNTETVGGSGNQPVTLDIGTTNASNGSGTGQLNRSFDGSVLTFGANDSNANMGTFGTDNRVIAQVGINPTAAGAINTTTYGSFNSDDDNRAAVEVNPTTIYNSGKATPVNNGGLRYYNGLTTGGGTTGTEVSGAGTPGGTTNNVRGLTLAFNGELFYTSALGTGNAAPYGTPANVGAGVYTSVNAAGSPVFQPTAAGDNDVNIIPDPSSVGGSAAKVNGLFVADMNGDGLLDAGDKIFFLDPTHGLCVSTFAGGNQANPANWSTATLLPGQINVTSINANEVYVDVAGQVISPTEVELYVTAYDKKGDTQLYNYDFGGTNTQTTMLSGTAPADNGLSYSGVAFAPEAATTLTEMVSTHSILASPEGSVTFTATVSSPNGTPTGNVFFINDVNGATTVLNTGGSAISFNAGTGTYQATFTTSSLPIGQDTIYAYYAGTSTIAAATTGTQLVSVTGSNAASVNITGVSPYNPTTVGETINYTAAVANNSGNNALPAPSGSVSFFDGSIYLGDAPISGGMAVLTPALQVATLPVAESGTNITAEYDGDANYQGITSGPFVVTVNPGATIVIGPSTSGSTTPGASVTFTATVSGNGLGGTPNGSPSGTVQFYEDGSSTAFATGTLSGTAGANVWTTTGALSGITAGSHIITATYFPDSFSEYASALTAAAEPTVAPYIETAVQALVPGDLVVLRRETDTSNQAGFTYLDVYNTSGTLQQTIILPDVDNAATNTYAVNISDKRPQEGAVTRSPDGSTISILGFDFPINGGDPENNATELAVANINLSGAVDTSTEVAVGAEAGLVEARSAVADGSEIYFNTNHTGTSTGIQEAADGTVNSAAPVGPASSSGSDAEILGNQLYVSNGSDVIDLVGTFGGGVPTSQTTLTALPGLSTDYVGLFLPPGGTAGPNPYSFLLFNHLDGTSVDPDTLYLADQTYGLLKFYNSTEVNGDPTTGMWVLTGQKLNNNNGLEGLTGYEINPGASGYSFQLYATAAISTGNPGNQLLKFTDTNAYNAGNPSTGGGFSTGAFTVIGPGVDTQASYSGLSFAPGYFTTINMTAGPNDPAIYGTADTVTATITAQDSTGATVGNVPTGIVIFTVDGVPQPEVTLVNGVATLMLPAGLAVGNHTITAAYEGDYKDDTQSASLMLPVQGATMTTTTITSNTPNPSNVGENVAFNVTVSPTSAFANGDTVQLDNGGVAISGATGTLSNGTVTINVLNLPAGMDQITAVYEGDSEYQGSTSTPAVTQNVLTVTPGGSPNPVLDGNTAPIYNLAFSNATGMNVVTVTTEGNTTFASGAKVWIDQTSVPADNGEFTIQTGSASTNTFTYIDNNPGASAASTPAGGTATVVGGAGSLGTGAVSSPTDVGTQRSMVDSIVYSFAAPIAAPTVQITVPAGDTGTVPSVNVNSPDSTDGGKSGTTWVITFSGAGVSGGSIANGEYQIVLTAGSYTKTDTFYRLLGDLNGDLFVNAADTLKFKQALTTYSAAADFNADDFVNASDNLKLKAALTGVNFNGFMSSI